jgi:recombination protein RecT
MATVDSLKNQIQEKPKQVVSAKDLDLKGLIATPTMQKKFDEILKEKKVGFTSSLLSLVSNDTYLRQAEPSSILAAAMTAAILDLPIDKNLGYAWIVPFKDKNQGGRQIAQFQLGYKGYIQLALRTGQYVSINAIPVYEKQLVSWNPLTEELKLNFEEQASNVVIGYAGYFELLNGFKKTVYWSKTQVENHKTKYSKGGMGWNRDWDAMALKTVIKNMLSKWGILSIEMQNAFKTDENEVKEVTNEGFIDVIEYEPETGEILG